MNKVINYENLRSFAYSNVAICTTPIKGIMVDFFGLGAQVMYDEHPQVGKDLAQSGILMLIPYNNPWAWMNKQAVAFTDEIIRVVMEKYALPAGTPIVSSGGSMGGLAALVYTRYAAITPVACAANCPVCDLPYHYTERPDLPRTLYSAFWGSETLEAGMRAASPLHLAGEMPDIDYCIFHCEKDRAVNIEKHSGRFVKEMQKHRRVQYYRVPDRDHCDLPPEYSQKYGEFIHASILARQK